ncbi:hypothetical protein BC835DRAFT_1349836 [Cytidiella melzeri]|nr:hypothetical protein BC835DRAFT_1349836 [Cytidiella melzeri]
MSSLSALSAPLYLWYLYVEYLWNYKQGTWVYRIASTAWILAFIVLTPFVFLTLLDVASYVIARTLGVIDATKASTGEMPVPARSAAQNDSDLDGGQPSIRVGAEPLTSSSASNNDHDSLSDLRDNVVEDGNLKLSGAYAFSPVPSQPPSPILSRRDLNSAKFNVQPMTDLSGKTRRKRSDSETSGEKSSEEATASQRLHIRRRGRDRGDDLDE